MNKEEKNKEKPIREPFYWASNLRITRDGSVVEFTTGDYPKGKYETVEVSVYQLSEIIRTLSRIMDEHEIDLMKRRK